MYVNGLIFGDVGEFIVPLSNFPAGNCRIPPPPGRKKPHKVTEDISTFDAHACINDLRQSLIIMARLVNARSTAYNVMIDL